MGKATRQQKSARKRSGKATSKSKAIKEEEKALQEEEEQRLKAEQEARERQEAEEKKQRAIELNESLAVLQEEQRPETDTEIEAIDALFEKPANYVKPDPEWERYMKCNRKPDPTSKTQINTFITITKEKTNTNIDEVLEETSLILEMINQLEFIKKDPEQTVTEHQAQEYKQMINTLEELIMLRYNEATLKILKEAAYEADPDSGNLQKVFDGKNEILYIWGNLNKNPRFKSYEFNKDLMRFEIPKVLATADFAIRILKTKFDPYSHYCETYFPRPKKIIIEVPEVEAEEEKDVVDLGLCVKSDKSSTSAKPSATVVPLKVSPGVSTVSSTTSNISKSALKNRRPASAKKKKTIASFRNEKKEEQDRLSAMGVDDNETVASSLLNTIVEEVAAIDEVLDLRLYTRLGEVFHVNLLEMPPQPKLINGWTLRQVIDKSLTNYPFGSSGHRSSAGQQSLSGLPNTDMYSEEKKRYTLNESQSVALGLSFVLPSNVFLLDKPQVAMWDKTSCRWKTNGITDIAYGEQKTISFKTKEPGIFGLFQKTYINMPFSSWELRPKAENCCYMIITGPKAEAEFEFKGSKCRLKHAGQSAPSEMKHLIDKWFEVDELISQMQISGLNFFPPDDAEDILNVEFKKIDLDRLYHEMAIMSSSFAFSWSKWNSCAPLHQVVIKAAAFYVSGTDHDFDSVPDEDWCHYLVSADRCYRLNLPYYTSEFDTAIHESATHNCDLLHALRLTSLKGDVDQSYLASVFERSRSVDLHYASAVYQMLKAINPISFS